MCHVEDSCKREEEEDNEIYMKLSVTPVTGRDTLVATVPSICGINNLIGITGISKVKDERL